MKEFILASSNPHKAEEFQELFAEVIKVSSATEKLDVIEDSDTFHGNALKKAQGYYEKFKVPTMSDDSGLVVEALPNELGVHSARFAPEVKTYAEKCGILIDKLREASTREAYFVCVLCFYLNPDEIYFVEGRLPGEIASIAQGEEGFGYDPVFIPAKAEGSKTLAMIPEWKAKHSHRAKAAQQAQNFFLNL